MNEVDDSDMLNCFDSYVMDYDDTFFDQDIEDPMFNQFRHVNEFMNKQKISNDYQQQKLELYPRDDQQQLKNLLNSQHSLVNPSNKQEQQLEPAPNNHQRQLEPAPNNHQQQLEPAPNNHQQQMEPAPNNYQQLLQTLFYRQLFLLNSCNNQQLQFNPGYNSQMIPYGYNQLLTYYQNDLLNRRRRSPKRKVVLSEEANELKTRYYSIFTSKKSFPKEYILSIHKEFLSPQLGLPKMTRDERRQKDLYFIKYAPLKGEILNCLELNKPRILKTILKDVQKKNEE